MNAFRGFANWAVAAFVLAGACAAETFPDIAARAESLQGQNDLAGATIAYRQALQLKPDWSQGLWALGSIYYDSNQFGEAVHALSALVQLQPKAAAGFALLGLSEFETGAFSASLEHIGSALDLGLTGQPQMEGVLRFHQAELLAHAGDFDAALSKYAWFVQRGVKHDELLAALGAAALHREEFPDKIESGQTSLLIAVGKAVSMSMSGSIPDAQESFRRLVNEHRTTPYLHYLYGSLLVTTDVDAACEEMREELKLSPHNGTAEAMLSWLLFDDRQMQEEAEVLAKQAFRDAPKLPLTSYVYGRALTESGDLQAAVDYLQDAANQNPRDLLIHIALASAYARRGMVAQARAEREICSSMAEGAHATAAP